MYAHLCFRLLGWLAHSFSRRVVLFVSVSACGLWEEKEEAVNVWMNTVTRHLRFMSLVVLLWYLFSNTMAHQILTLRFDKLLSLLLKNISMVLFLDYTFCKHNKFRIFIFFINNFIGTFKSMSA